MGRPKKFCREDVLKKALPVFWARGFADTGLQDLEEATGVNKSGLYSEFKDKEDIFLESLRYYYDSRDHHAALNAEPLGWKNIEAFLKSVTQVCTGKQKGCFGVNSMRELSVLPSEAQAIVNESRNRLKRLFVKNIEAEKTKLAPESLAEILSTFLSGLCIEQNLKTDKSSNSKKIDDFLNSLRSM